MLQLLLHLCNLVRLPILLLSTQVMELAQKVLVASDGFLRWRVNVYMLRQPPSLAARTHLEKSIFPQTLELRLMETLPKIRYSTVIRSRRREAVEGAIAECAHILGSAAQRGAM